MDVLGLELWKRAKDRRLSCVVSYQPVSTVVHHLGLLCDPWTCTGSLRYLILVSHLAHVLCNDKMRCPGLSG